MATEHPEWALKHKKSKTELRLIRGRYYLYEVSSRWNPTKKRAQKITGKMLGRITQEEGFIPTGTGTGKVSREAKAPTVLASKEYGTFAWMSIALKESLDRLKAIFPEDYGAIICTAFCRLLHQSPLKNMPFHLARSFWSEQDFDSTFSAKQIGETLNKIGKQRPKIMRFFESYIQGEQSHLLIDMTAIHSQSKQLSLAKKGYNSAGNFDPQANLLLLFSNTLKLPVYYRLLPGNVRDVKAFQLSLKESGVQDATLIADKGFYSQANLDQLDEAQLRYVMPLRRNHSLIDYAPLEQSAKKGISGYFKYQKRHIWYVSTPIENSTKRIILFLDDSLKVREENDYLDRILTHPETHSFSEFQQKCLKFGTLTLLSNIPNASEQDIYELYKSRNNIEVAFDTLKTTLEADRSYMRNEDSLEGWMFINHLALIWHYQISNLLQKYQLLSTFSPKDFLMHLSEIKKIKLNDHWHLAEITASTQKLLAKLGVDIT